jgi:hypothetical protein
VLQFAKIYKATIQFLNRFLTVASLGTQPPGMVSGINSHMRVCLALKMNYGYYSLCVDTNTPFTFPLRVPEKAHYKVMFKYKKQQV